MIVNGLYKIVQVYLIKWKYIYSNTALHFMLLCTSSIPPHLRGDTVLFFTPLCLSDITADLGFIY